MNECLAYFLERFNKKGTVVELGTARWGKNPTHHRHLWPEATHIGVDIIDGEDVNIVCDAEELSKSFSENTIDAVYSASTFEHIKHPWIAASEIMKILKPGGVVFIQTHQNFPIHAYPNFYYLFSTEALESLFEAATSIKSCYEFPCVITPEDKTIAWNKDAKAFLNVCVVAVK